MIPEDAMTITEVDWHGHVVWYIRDFWSEVQQEAHNKEIDEIYDKNCVEQQFQLARANLGRDGKGAVTVQVWGVVVL